jgi:uncharacterized repeat protein (TIGR03803 family)
MLGKLREFTGAGSAKQAGSGCAKSAATHRTLMAFRRCLIGSGLAVSVLPFGGAYAAPLHVIHTFAGAPNDGARPQAALVADGQGNLYGTTEQGGTYNSGTVYKVAPDGTESVLYSFDFGLGGRLPYSSLILDKTGNLYGTAYAGGSGGYGTVYELTTDGTQSPLFSFSCGTGGGTPTSRLARDAKGNLYGTTLSCGANSLGVAFKIARNGRETVLHAFAGGKDGSSPSGGLTMDENGNLYGVTTSGGGSGAGIIYELSPPSAGSKKWKETVLYSFTGGVDGSVPVDELIMDKTGNLYGTTYYGGKGASEGGYPDGTVYKLAPEGTETVLYSFSGLADGANPTGVVADSKGNLYGTTEEGGTEQQTGVVFEVTPKGNEKILHTFAGGNDGENPFAGVILLNGLLYGTAYTDDNSAGLGTIFKLKQ